MRVPVRTARLRHSVALHVSTAQRLVAVGEVALAPRQPLIELGVVDAAVEEDDEPQPGAAKRADEVPHVAPQLQELAAAYPVERPARNTRPVWPASQKIAANWQRLAEAGGCLELDLVLAGRAGGRVGRSLWAAAFHRGRDCS